MTISKESQISREHASRILASLNRADEYDPLGDYYLASGEAGEEYLTVWGQDSPVAMNCGTTSWIS